MKAIHSVFSYFSEPLPSLFFAPRRYRPHGVGYWSGHIPFACDLIYTLRPSRFVELGTHTGESYFSFCQAIEESGIDCRAFAVDTWRGDQHTGSYGEKVFEEVSDCNQAYRQFSTLLRMTFDEAAPQFAQDSIDLLHIDGAHTYEAVQHDFELWWPKLKAGGVVIMHDSNERGHGFGVWRWLDELRQRLPAEGFLHSHGLGVVVKPPLPSGANVATKFANAQPGDLEAIRRYYEMCAAYQRQKYLLEHRRPDDWEVNAQLFWRTSSDAFCEESSVRTAEIVGAMGATLLLPIPECQAPLEQLRIVPSLEPALLAVKEFWIENSAGHRVFGDNGRSSLAEWQARGLQASAGSQGAIVFDRTGRNGLTVEVDKKTRQHLQAGGRLYLHLIGMDPFTCAAELTAKQNDPVPAQHPSLLRRLFTRP